MCITADSINKEKGVNEKSGVFGGGGVEHDFNKISSCDLSI